jgi:hypothetical protein
MDKENTVCVYIYSMCTYIYIYTMEFYSAINYVGCREMDGIGDVFVN